ncbi:MULTISPECIES: RidA family protein [Comamonas]|uniref:Putative ferredoxin n=2 Tax=Pseudomonadota TaxID=1224 RepID=Q2PQU2_PSEPU|nr:MULTISPECIES: RidA family protein [Comamonas]ABB13576.1 putative ferredoxin [Comamonas testosteroni CNB-1]ABC41266.1 putative ferredoxin [Pseudomonas putida]MDO1476739.1 RidA family protein [Comamonas thiooxydans]
MSDVLSLQRVVLPSKSLPRPRFHYSPVVQVGPFVFVGGLVALDASTGALIEGGTYLQARQVLANLASLAKEMGWSLEQLLLVRIFCTDFAAFPEINRAWEEFFGDLTPPTRTFVGVLALPLGALVEMEFQFVVPPAVPA